ncbi:hypothetical protein BCO_0900130 (plasmid) [Borrelia coriaceae ATCC 43381]|uniref:Uncharacterized protein n=1 Tax=Borrelia coriaceae ATCC 43381 TaxID=1408429 RepID=W5T312_9SPIR|nr:hypothetical protein BCO_0900130 [Borrelia coriaceae ATCC 43381]
MFLTGDSSNNLEVPIKILIRDVDLHKFYKKIIKE